MESEKPKITPRDYLANERTFLAWVRTSIGIMAFGFVVVKFSFLFKAVFIDVGYANTESTPGNDPSHYSSSIGIVLVLLGMFVMIMSYVRYRSTNKQLDAGEYQHSSLTITLLTAVLFLISMLLVYYLIKA